jgi:moderate conductance mechanosensitive channel
VLALTRLGRIVIILLVAWLLQALARRVIRAFHHRMSQRTSAPEELRRIRTVGTVFSYFATVVVVLVAGTATLNELGISVAPILATAGVAGVAIGFGAQSLVKDYFTGLVLLIEDQISAGDVVEILGKAGEVEEVTLRYVRLRDGDGYVHFIPNGEIKSVSNRTRGHAYAMIDAAIEGHQYVEPACAAMRDIGAGMREDETYGPKILADVEVFGIERWELWGIGLRCRLKVLPFERDSVRREFTRRLIAEFDRREIKSP